MTDWLWEIKERAEQKEQFIDYRKNRVIFFSPEEQHRRMIMKQRMVSCIPFQNRTLSDFCTVPEPRSIFQQSKIQFHDNRIDACVRSPRKCCKYYLGATYNPLAKNSEQIKGKFQVANVDFSSHFFSHKQGIQTLNIVSLIESCFHACFYFIDTFFLSFH